MIVLVTVEAEADLEQIATYIARRLTPARTECDVVFGSARKG